MSIRAFLSGLYHFVLKIIMWIPCHPLRRFWCIVTMKRFGSSSGICRNVDIRSPYRITIGEHTVINRNCVLDGRGGLDIGDNVDIAQEVNIWTEQHNYNSPIYDSVCSPVKIEDYVWIASRATILPGVTIGRGAVIAACSVVTKDIPPMSIVAGIPAKIIGKRDDVLNYNQRCRFWFK